MRLYSFLKWFVVSTVVSGLVIFLVGYFLVAPILHVQPGGPNIP